MPLLVPAEVVDAVQGSSVQNVDIDAAQFSCDLATAFVCGYIRRPPALGIPADLLWIAYALAVRIAVNPAQYRRMSVDVEGTSFSATYTPWTFSLAEQMVLNKYRKRTA